MTALWYYRKSKIGLTRGISISTNSITTVNIISFKIISGGSDGNGWTFTF